MALEPWKADLIAQLPQIRAEHEKLGQLIQLAESWEDSDDESLEEKAAASAAPRRASGQPGQVRAIGPDEFVNMSTSKAVKAFLAIKGKGNPQGPREMAKALVAGGQASDEEKAYENVRAVLKRMKKDGEITQVRRGQWGLALWYANSSPAK